MKKIIILALFLSLWSCNDDPISNLEPIDLTSCFSPEFGITEDEQFFYDASVGELQVDLNSTITTFNVGYSIEEGSKIVFVYRHFL